MAPRRKSLSRNPSGPSQTLDAQLTLTAPHRPTPARTYTHTHTHSGSSMAATKTATDEQPARRRSSRASIVPPPRSAPKNPVVPNKKKNKAAAEDSDSDLSEQESDSDDDQEQQQEQTGRKRKARSSVAAAAAGNKHGGSKKVVVAAGAEGKPKAVTKKAKGTREIKPKPRRAPITGLNPLPTLFSLFPSHSLFTLPSSDAEPEPLPTPTEAPRTIFVFGTGDMGQNGLGVDDPKALDEIKRPRKHIGFADKVMRRQLGWEGGVADLVCGGMHTLAIDGQGKVWSWGYVVSSCPVFWSPPPPLAR